MKKYPTNEERKSAKAAKALESAARFSGVRNTTSVNPFADEKEETTTGHNYMVDGKYNPDMSEVNAMNDRKLWNKR